MRLVQTRREVLKTTITASALPTSISGTGVAARSGSEFLLLEDFESYSNNSYPPSWTKSGNTDQYIVETDDTISGSRVLGLMGQPGGCWEALANRSISLPDTGVIEFVFHVFPTDRGDVGCHNHRAKVALRTSDDSWDAGQGTKLWSLSTDGAFVAADGSNLGGYDLGNWNEIRIRYQRDKEVTLSYSLNGEDRGSATRAVHDFEDDLSYIQLGSGEFISWWDDISVEAINEQTTATTSSENLAGAAGGGPEQTPTRTTDGSQKPGGSNSLTGIVGTVGAVAFIMYLFNQWMSGLSQKGSSSGSTSNQAGSANSKNISTSQNQSNKSSSQKSSNSGSSSKNSSSSGTDTQIWDSDS